MMKPASTMENSSRHLKRSWHTARPNSFERPNFPKVESSIWSPNIATRSPMKAVSRRYFSNRNFASHNTSLCSLRFRTRPLSYSFSPAHRHRFCYLHLLLQLLKTKRITYHQLFVQLKKKICVLCCHHLLLPPLPSLQILHTMGRKRYIRSLIDFISTSISISP